MSDEDNVQLNDGMDSDSSLGGEEFLRALRELMEEYGKTLEEVVEILEEDADWFSRFDLSEVGDCKKNRK